MLTFLAYKNMYWGLSVASSVIAHLPRMHEALGLILEKGGKNREGEKKKKRQRLNRHFMK